MCSNYFFALLSASRMACVDLKVGHSVHTNRVVSVIFSVKEKEIVLLLQDCTITESIDFSLSKQRGEIT